MFINFDLDLLRDVAVRPVVFSFGGHYRPSLAQRYARHLATEPTLGVIINYGS